MFLQSPHVGSDAVFFGFLLAVCLLYYCNTSIHYLTTFNHGIFDFGWRPIGRDFVNYWTGGVAVFTGMIPEIFDVNLFHPYQEELLGHRFAEHNWSYPPHMLLVVWPLGLMPYLWALASWSFGTLALYLWAASAGRPDRWLLVLALLLAPATFENFSGGQNGFITGALLIGGMRLLGPRPVVAGILFGLLTIKPQLGLLLPFALIAGRHWTAFISAGVTTVALVVLSVVLFGWESWQAYRDLVVPLQTEIMNERDGIFTAMMPSAYMGLRVLEVAPFLRWGAQLLCSAIAFAGVVWTFARSDNADLKFSVLAVGGFLASPYVFNYDMTTLSLAVALVALHGVRHGFRPGERLVLLAAWLLPSAMLWFNISNIPVSPLLLLACFAYFLLRVRDGRPREAGGTAGWTPRPEAAAP